MGRFDVECLRCGDRHALERASRTYVQDSECPRCGYLGWASVLELDEALRRLIRTRPPEARRLRLAG
ncbi:MAG: hypothetical protein WD689_04160 [Gaiellaceae bacterium]